MTDYASLGVRPIINATGTYTRLGGSLMPDEVLAAMERAARQFVCLEELQYSAGRRIAELTGAEASYVTSGAQAALTLSIAACLTGLDAARMDRLPDTRDIPHRVVMASLHRNHYDHAVEAAGGQIVTIGDGDHCTAAQIGEACGDEVAAVLHAPWHEDRLPLADVVREARRRGKPVVVDAAGCCDEPDNLREFVATGADLVCFSGGKYIRGPQASGFVCGRAPLISAIAWQHLDMDFTPEVWTAPRSLVDPTQLAFVPRQGIGRGFKAGKEEIVGLVTALELYLRRDHVAEKQACAARLERLAVALAEASHVRCERLAPDSVRRGFPRLRIRFDERALRRTALDIIRALKAGTPSIHPGEHELAAGAIIIHPFNLSDGDELEIARRVAEIVRG